MTYLGRLPGAGVPLEEVAGEVEQRGREALVLVVEDGVMLTDALRQVCECLGIGVERIPTTANLGAALRERHPMAIVATMEGAGQDGCHVLKTVAGHCRDLPVLLIVGDDQALLGAADAVEELWQLTSVEKWSHLMGIGSVVDFLFRAGRGGNCMRLMSV